MGRRPEFVPRQEEENKRGQFIQELGTREQKAKVGRHGSGPSGRVGVWETWVRAEWGVGRHGSGPSEGCKDPYWPLQSEREHRLHGMDTALPFRGVETISAVWY